MLAGDVSGAELVRNRVLASQGLLGPGFQETVRVLTVEERPGHFAQDETRGRTRVTLIPAAQVRSRTPRPAMAVYAVPATIVRSPTEAERREEQARDAASAAPAVAPAATPAKASPSQWLAGQSIAPAADVAPASSSAAPATGTPVPTPAAQDAAQTPLAAFLVSQEATAPTSEQLAERQECERRLREAQANADAAEASHTDFIASTPAVIGRTPVRRPRNFDVRFGPKFLRYQPRACIPASVSGDLPVEALACLDAMLTALRYSRSGEAWWREDGSISLTALLRGDVFPFNQPGVTRLTLIWLMSVAPRHIELPMSGRAGAGVLPSSLSPA